LDNEVKMHTSIVMDSWNYFNRGWKCVGHKGAYVEK
jgi:hypothetical protein